MDYTHKIQNEIKDVCALRAPSFAFSKIIDTNTKLNELYKKPE